MLAGWEAGLAAPEIARGTAALSVLDCEGDAELFDAPIGELAALAAEALADLLSASEVASSEVVVDCEQCGQQLEFRLPLAELQRHDAHDPEQDLEVGGECIVLRPPSMRDLLAAAGSEDAAAALVARCASRGDGPLQWHDLTAADRDRVDTALEALSGSALSRVATDCPHCGRRIEAVIDATSLLWNAVADTAPRLLSQVATLATAFGWSEDEVLALSPARRAAYLDLVSR
jgi:hypothetical protein